MDGSTMALVDVIADLRESLRALEKTYATAKADYDALLRDCGGLIAERDRLRNELAALKSSTGGGGQ